MPGTVEMQPDLVIRQAALGEISPALAVNQHAGFQIGKAAALGPDPGSGGDSHLRTGARKIQIAQEGDGSGAVAQLNSLGKNRASVEIVFPLVQNQGLRIGYRRQIEIHRIIRRDLLFDLVHQGLQLFYGLHGIVLIPVVQRPGGGDDEILAQPDDITVFHVNGPDHLVGVCTADKMDEGDHGGGGGIVVMSRLGGLHGAGAQLTQADFRGGIVHFFLKFGPGVGAGVLIVDKPSGGPGKIAAQLLAHIDF